MYFLNNNRYEFLFNLATFQSIVLFVFKKFLFENCHLARYFASVPSWKISMGQKKVCYSCTKHNYLPQHNSVTIGLIATQEVVTSRQQVSYYDS